jgi:hypothetical protein
MKKIMFLSFLVVLILSSLAQAKWHGYAKQGYQRRVQLFEPSEVRPWLSDAVSSATRVASESGPVTEIESLWDFELPSASITAGLFGRVLGYSEATYCYLLYPWFKYQSVGHTVSIGREKTQMWGSGLLVSEYPALGITYLNNSFGFETRAFYLAVLEHSEFQKANIQYGGISGTFQFSRGQLGFLYTYDASKEFADASRSALNAGSALSMQGNWEWNNDWYAEYEVVYAKALALFAGLDLPLLPFLPLQARVRFTDENYNPVLSGSAREGNKQTTFALRFPIHFFSEQFILRPSWGVKHTPDQNYWVPGVQLDCTLMESLWIQGRMFAEQPQDQWGALEHYEYTELNLIWMINAQLYLDVHWAKTFNGFLEWKETQSLAGLEFRW